MRVVITGARGLLGTAVMQVAPAHGLTPVAWSSSGEGVAWHAELPWQETAQHLAGVDAVIHSAAFIPANHQDPASAERCLTVNALGTLNLLRAVEAAGVPRFVLVSGANICAPRGPLVTEDDPLGCEYSPYYLGSKVLAEVYTRAAFARGLTGMIVRPSSIFGPGMRGGMFVAFGAALAAGRPLVVRDAGAFRADYVWRDDVADVLCRAVQHPRTGVVNVGLGETFTALQVASIMAELAGAGTDAVRVEGDPREPFGFAPLDLTRAREWFGFAPTSLRSGLQQLRTHEG